MIWTEDYDMIIDLSEYPTAPNCTDEDIKKAYNEITRKILQYGGMSKIGFEIIRDDLTKFIGYKVIRIIVEECFCITAITDEWEPIEISDYVYPFDFDNNRYPMQMIKTSYQFVR